MTSLPSNARDLRLQSRRNNNDHSLFQKNDNVLIRMECVLQNISRWFSYNGDLVIRLFGDLVIWLFGDLVIRLTASPHHRITIS